MGLLLKQLFSLIRLLNSETGTNQIATGVAAGFILGMTPFFSLQTLLVFVLLLFFRIQIGAAFLSAFFFAFVAYLLDPAFHAVGTWALELSILQPIYTELYNLPLVPYTRFNNTIAMGSGLVAIVLSPFVYWAARGAVVKYRATVLARWQGSKAFKALKATSLYQWYYKYDQLYGSN